MFHKNSCEVYPLRLLTTLLSVPMNRKIMDFTTYIVFIYHFVKHSNFNDYLSSAISLLLNKPYILAFWLYLLCNNIDPVLPLIHKANCGM